MRDLCEQTGLSRQAIHFYIQQGLVPEGKKTGRNMAWYGPEHVERLQLIRRLQEERYLPLKAIRALLAGETSHLAPAQRTLLAEVASRLAPRGKPAMVDAADACARAGLDPAELARMIDLGFVTSRDGKIPSDSTWLLDLWAQFRALGFTAALGFDVSELSIYEEAVQRMFERETQLAIPRLEHLPPERVAEMIERSLPLIHAIVIQLHTQAVKNFFAVMQREETP